MYFYMCILYEIIILHDTYAYMYASLCFVKVDECQREYESLTERERERYGYELGLIKVLEDLVKQVKYSKLIVLLCVYVIFCEKENESISH